MTTLIRRNPPSVRAWTAEDIKAFRHTLGITQRPFAAAVGCYIDTLRSWEEGKAIPSPIFNRLISQLADEYNYVR